MLPTIEVLSFSSFVFMVLDFVYQIIPDTLSYKVNSRVYRTFYDVQWFCGGLGFEWLTCTPTQ